MTSVFNWRTQPSQITKAINPSPKARENPGTATPIEQLTKDGQTIRRFASLADASRSTGVDLSGIGRVANGFRRTAGGFRWRYVTPETKILANRHGGQYSRAVQA